MKPYHSIKFLFLIFSMMVTMSAMAHVNLKSPKGGETLDPGATVKIEWEETIAQVTQNWDLYFSTDGGKTYEALKLDINVKTLAYDWIVPSTATKEARIRVVEDNAGDDYSDESGDFTIAGTSTASEKVLEHIDITLYPNPATNYVHINTSQSALPIEDVLVSENLGRKVSAQISVREHITNEYYLAVSNWPPGIYFISIVVSNGVVVRKLVIQ
ncbi:T9SS type A sorting domain-containing protein [Membranicola marinus]|uniref:T9SS type A sorting domain-containing protein n=1 Tax=Membranihabitans marinus TaxID=1227546 RepID=A0A953LCA7_9BACT|nr:T9SS type A sorting domain-containing protein [Membranihabitans marinus]MBY5957554.1 T9SS type A sorting domain-containing protein [Membranihabitans marinus]